MEVPDRCSKMMMISVSEVQYVHKPYCAWNASLPMVAQWLKAGDLGGVLPPR